MTREPPENATEREIIRWFFEEGIKVLDAGLAEMDTILSKMKGDKQ
jgi:hypothetical protein